MSNYIGQGMAVTGICALIGFAIYQTGDIKCLWGLIALGFIGW